MGKEKKISVKYYLNEKSVPKTTNSVEKYPLYVRITYNRESTQLRVLDINSMLIYFEPNQIENINKDVLEKVLKSRFNRYYCDPFFIEKIIRFESNNKRNKFNLKGFSNLLWTYSFREATDATVLKYNRTGTKERGKYDSYLTQSLASLDLLSNTADFLSEALAINIQVPDSPYLMEMIIPGFIKSLPKISKTYLLNYVLVDIFETRRSSLGPRSSVFYFWYMSDLEKCYEDFLKNLANNKINIASPKYKRILEELNFSKEDIPNCILHLENAFQLCLTSP